MTHICVGNQRHQCQAGILSIEPLGTNFSEILTEIKKFYSRRGIWKCRLRNCGHFVSASMCLKNVLGHPMSISTIVSPMLMHWIDRCIETALWVWIAEYCLFLKIGDLVLTWPEISRHWPVVNPIWEQPNTVIRLIRHKLLHHLVSFLPVTQITRLKKSSKGVIYEESLHRRSASTWLFCYFGIFYALLHDSPVLLLVWVTYSFINVIVFIEWKYVSSVHVDEIMTRLRVSQCGGCCNGAGAIWSRR